MWGPWKLLEALSTFCSGRIGKGEQGEGAQGCVGASSFLLPYPAWGSPHPGWRSEMQAQDSHVDIPLGLVPSAAYSLHCSPLGPLGLW